MISQQQNFIKVQFKRTLTCILDMQVRVFYIQKGEYRVKKVYKESQLNELNNIPVEVIESIKVTIDILNENYGENRDIEADLGGYVFIAENIVDIEILKQDKLQGLVPEYTDVIEVMNGENYTSSLYLLSSDFAIVVVTTEELSKFLLK